MNTSTPNNINKRMMETPSLFTPSSLSQTPSSQGQQSQVDRSLVPCTIKQLQTFEKSGKLHGRPISTVCLIGQLLSCEHKETSVEMMIDDSTGVTKCIWWANNEMTKKLSAGQYLRLYCKWTSNNCIVHNAVELKSRNEVTLH
eukprot:UN22939